MIPLSLKTIFMSKATTVFFVVGFFVLLIGGSYYLGYDSASEKYQKQLSSLEIESDALSLRLRAAQAETRAEVIVEYIDKIKTIKEKEYVYIKEAASVVPSRCDLSSGWVYTHDIGATGGDIDTTRSADGTASEVKDNQALAIVVENYSICHQTEEKLKSLQKWIVIEQQNLKTINRDSANK